MISRTSCAHRQPRAMRAAHSSASSREGTSMIENPPMTAFVSGAGPSVSAPSAHDGRLLALHASAEDLDASVFSLLDHGVRFLAHLRPVLVLHRDVVE